MVVSTPTASATSMRSTPRPASAALSRFNDELFAELELTPPEEIWYTSFDGRKIHGLVQKPPDFDAAQKYPLILNIHGGPHAAYGYTFFHEFQWMAAKGYVVLYPNPRGSTTLRAGVRQRHPVPLPGRRLQGPDGGRRRAGQARRRRPEAPGRHRRQRRRRAHQLDHHPDRPLRRGRLAALDLRLGRLVVHRRLHAVHAALVPRARPFEQSAGLRGALRHHAGRPRQDAADADRGRGRLAHASRERRRADVPRAQVPARSPP